MHRRSADPSAPRVEALRLEGLADADPTALRREERYEGARFDGAGFGGIEGIDLEGATFGECLLQGWHADGAKLQGARFLDTRIERMAATELHARRTTWRGVEVDASRVGALECYDSELDAVVVEGSRLTWVNLRGSRLTDVVFRGCRIDELDLADAELERVAFAETTVERLVLTRAGATHLDLRGLDVGGTVEGLEGMRGAMLRRDQVTAMAELFAVHLGIEVAD